MRREGESGVARGLLLLALGAVGAALVAVPWLWQRQEELPPVVVARTPLFGELLDLGAEVDRASAVGDLRRLRDLLTADCLARIEKRLREVGRTLDAGALREQGRWVGDLRSLRFLYGASSGERICLAFSGGAYAQTAGEQALLVEFVRLPRGLCMHDRYERRLPEAGRAPGAALEDRARRLVESVLGASLPVDAR